MNKKKQKNTFESTKEFKDLEIILNSKGIYIVEKELSQESETASSLSQARKLNYFGNMLRTYVIVFENLSKPSLKKLVNTLGYFVFKEDYSFLESDIPNTHIISIETTPIIIKRIREQLFKLEKDAKMFFYRTESKGRTVDEQTRILKSKSPDFISSLETEFLKNKNSIVIDDISHCIDNLGFIDFVIKNKVAFTSLSNPNIAKSFCNALHYLSDKLNEKKGGNRKAGMRRQIEADSFALKMGPIFDELDTAGFKSVRAKAEELNNRNIESMNGKKWTHHNVHATLKRWQKLKEEENQNSSISKPPKPE